jgi:hypothetical protein
MNVSRPILNKATTYERELIQRRLSRASAIKILSGCSIRKTAEELGVSKKQVEQEEERRKKSLIYPLPDDKWTLAGTLHLATRIHQSKGYAAEMDGYNDEEYDDPNRERPLPYDRFSEMNEQLELMHQAWCDQSYDKYTYLLVDYSFEDIKAAVFKDIDKLCEISIAELEELVPDESAQRHEDIDANKQITNHYAWSSNYGLQVKYSESQNEILRYIINKEEKSTEIEQQSAIEEFFSYEDFDDTAAVNPAETVAKYHANSRIKTFVNSLEELKDTVNYKGITVDRLKKKLEKEVSPELLSFLRSI